MVIKKFYGYIHLTKLGYQASFSFSNAVGHPSVKGNDMPKKDKKVGKEKIIVKKKIFCPICGNAAIRPVKKKFKCLNCKALFSKPRKTKIKLRRTPRYIG